LWHHSSPVHRSLALIASTFPALAIKNGKFTLHFGRDRSIVSMKIQINNVNQVSQRGIGQSQRIRVETSGPKK
ncbi:MAG: hypothetical protein AAGE59_21565, partial [Cyanobacteria bacterium P01_F01_bin.86]